MASDDYEQSLSATIYSPNRMYVHIYQRVKSGFIQRIVHILYSTILTHRLMLITRRDNADLQYISTYHKYVS